MNTRIPFLVVTAFALLLSTPRAHAQIYTLIGPDMAYSTVTYESPWRDAITHNHPLTIGGGADIGLQWQPRRSMLALRLYSGLRYAVVVVQADVKADQPFGEGFIVNRSFREIYQAVVVPLRAELLLKSPTARIVPGLYAGINAAVLAGAQGKAELVDGTSFEYDIATRAVAVSAAGGALLELVINRMIALDLRVGYAAGLQNLLSGNDVSLKLSGITAGAGVAIRIR
jgi:hypothetical protein